MSKSFSTRIGRVVFYSRGSVWYLRYHESGKRRQVRGSANKAEAKRLAAEINAQLETGAPTILGYEAIEVKELRQVWLDHHEMVLRSSPATVARYRTATDHLLRYLQHHPIKHLSAFKDSHAEHFIRHLRQLQVAPNGHRNTKKRALRDKGVKFILECCRAMFNFAMKRRHLPPYSENPFSTLEVQRIPLEDAKPIVLLTREQENAFFQQCDDWQFPLFVTLALTGLRVGDALTRQTLILAALLPVSRPIGANRLIADASLVPADQRTAETELQDVLVHSRASAEISADSFRNLVRSVIGPEGSKVQLSVELKEELIATLLALGQQDLDSVPFNGFAGLYGRWNYWKHKKYLRKAQTPEENAALDAISVEARTAFLQVHSAFWFDLTAILAPKLGDLFFSFSSFVDDVAAGAICDRRRVARIRTPCIWPSSRRLTADQDRCGTRPSFPLCLHRPLRTGLYAMPSRHDLRPQHLQPIPG